MLINGHVQTSAMLKVGKKNKLLALVFLLLLKIIIQATESLVFT